MFSLFSKKVFLKEQFTDFVDIHNHILPGIDDGASTVDDSLELLLKFSEMGITNFIATPHVMNDYYPNTPETIKEALATLKNALRSKGLTNFKISAAAEYMMDQAFLELIEREKLLCLNKNFVLVEMSYFQAPINLNEILFKLQTQQYKPVLAHPERYIYFHSKKMERYQELKQRGCFFQLNALSLVGHYGKNIQEAAFNLLDQGLIDFVGTDTHQLRHLEKINTLKIPRKRSQQLKPIIEQTKNTFSF